MRNALCRPMIPRAPRVARRVRSCDRRADTSGASGRRLSPGCGVGYASAVRAVWGTAGARAGSAHLSRLQRLAPLDPAAVLQHPVHLHALVVRGRRPRGPATRPAEAEDSVQRLPTALLVQHTSEGRGHVGRPGVAVAAVQVHLVAGEDAANQHLHKGLELCVRCGGAGGGCNGAWVSLCAPRRGTTRTPQPHAPRATADLGRRDAGTAVRP